MKSSKANLLSESTVVSGNRVKLSGEQRQTDNLFPKPQSECGSDLNVSVLLGQLSSNCIGHISKSRVSESPRAQWRFHGVKCALKKKFGRNGELFHG